MTMGTIGNPKTWVPYMNTQDCSRGFCSLDCPQWCYIVFPPPPPFQFPDNNSGPNFSPLVIAIIGILASAFLLVSYYAIISKYCRNRDSTRRGGNHDQIVELEGNEDPSNHEPWHVSTNGLDEALIKSITVCKYQKGDGLIGDTDCSVCLGEFQEDESLRLLPKCSHAFHVKCIDTWLRSHSNCPLCRANIGFVNAFPLQVPPPPVAEIATRNDGVVVEEDSETRVGGEVSERDIRNTLEGDTIIEIPDEEAQQIRRSVSMDYACQRRVFSISDMLRISQDHEGSSSKGVEMNNGQRDRVLYSVMSPVAMKRSFSSGRFLFTKHGRGQNVVIPL